MLVEGNPKIITIKSMIEFAERERWISSSAEFTTTCQFLL